MLITLITNGFFSFYALFYTHGGKNPEIVFLSVNICLSGKL